MKNVRIIPRLDIKGPNLIKGIQLEGLRVVGDPYDFAKKYYEQGADELLYIDIVASLYGRNQLTEIILRTASDIFIPITVGGGVRSVDNVDLLLRSGADKVAINTAAVKNPDLIGQVAERYGSQCMVLSIEAKKISDGKWEAYTDNGREHTGLDVIEWAKEGVRRGAGEILLTSVDQEGTKKGFDTKLVQLVSESVSVPIIASGGMGQMAHLESVIDSGADAVAIADVLHYNRISLKEIKSYMTKNSLTLRENSL